MATRIQTPLTESQEKRVAALKAALKRPRASVLQGLVEMSLGAAEQDNSALEHAIKNPK